MLLPALMLKTHSPAMELYEIRAISDADIRLANESFLERGLPYVVVRAADKASDFAA